jgi:hypothetical protein
MEIDEALETFSEICQALPRAFCSPYDRSETVSYSVGKPIDKTFAVLVVQERDRGILFRSVDPRVLADQRFQPTTTWSKKNNNWRRLPWTGEAPDWKELALLIAESHRLAQLKNAGFSKYEFGSLHPILGHALEVTDAAFRPPPPFHAGGPAPKLSGVSALRVAIHIAKAVGALVPRDQKALAAQALAAAQEAADTDDLKRRALLKALRDLAQSKPKDSKALNAARRAAGAAASLCHGKPDMVWNNAMLAAERAVQALVAAGRQAELPAFLSGLDERILGAEFATEVVDKGKQAKPPAIDRVLWRGDGGKGFPTLWLVRLAGGKGYGLLSKVGTRYAWNLGIRDDMLSSVPDTHFQQATAVALARDLSSAS